MIMPFGEESQQEMIRIKKVSKTKFIKENHGSCQFVPFLRGISNLEGN
jgi:protein-L-isoaspartate O-methyltransferase